MAVRTLFNGSDVTISLSDSRLLCPLMKLQENLTGCSLPAPFTDHAMQDQPNKEAFRFQNMFKMHEHESLVESFVICHLPEL
jgi:hypothetical protein